MQVIRAIGGSSEEYNDQAEPETVSAPERCPNCGLASAPSSLGYYEPSQRRLDSVSRKHDVR